MTRRGTRPAGLFVLAGLLVMLGAACHQNTPTPGPSPSGTATPRPFTVMTTDVFRVTDPAAVTDAAGSTLVDNVFQRLLTAEPGGDFPKPDAARDCLFTSPTVYSCTLNEKLRFSNGDPLTSSDVRFSIDRAIRLHVPGSSTSLLSSLRRIDAPDPHTVRFVLTQPDTQFGWALASPAASLVDERVYDADEVRPPTEPVVGSGPFSVLRRTPTELDLAKFRSYVGRTSSRLTALVLRTMPDSASIEDAMAKHQVDAVWRGLSAAAQTRLAEQLSNADSRTADGYTRYVLSGTGIRQLVWNPASTSRNNAGLRAAIVAALQGDRTLASIVPPQVAGYRPVFAEGGRARPKITWPGRIDLTLGYDPSAPDARDVADQVRSRLEDVGSLSVRLRPTVTGVDLALLDRKAWTATAYAWLQPYLDAPLPLTRTLVTELATQFRQTPPTQETKAYGLLSALQSQSAVDALVVPLSQRDEYLYLADGVTVTDLSFGPGWQLGLWGLGHG